MNERFTALALRMHAGLLAWAAHFGVIYGFTGLACARGWGEAIPWVVGGATLVALAACALFAVWGWRARAAFDGFITLAAAALGALAILWQALPAWMVPACA